MPLNASMRPLHPVLLALALVLALVTPGTPGGLNPGVQALAAQSEAGAPGLRQGRILGEGWRFQRGDHPGAAQPRFDDTGWEEITVPHDWAIAGPFIEDGDGNTGKLPWWGEGWYRRALDIPGSWAGKRV